MTHPRPLPWPLILGVAALLLLVAPASIFLTGQAVQGHAAAMRPPSQMAPVCPVGERRP